MTGTRSTVSRAHVSAWVIDTLEDMGNPVGDGNVPLAGAYGWQGEPNAEGSFFIPWLSSMPGAGRLNNATPGAFGDAGLEHILTYAISFNAVNREQVEWLADSTRKEFVNVERVQLDCGDYGFWSIQQVRNVSIGAVLRNRSTDPDFYLQTDQFDVWISKEIS